MRGSITKRGDSWLIRFDVGYDINANIKRSCIIKFAI